MEENKRYMLLALLLNLSIPLLSFSTGHTIYKFSKYAPSDGPLYYIVALNPFSFDKNVDGIRYVRILSPLVTYLFARGNELYTAISIECLNVLFFVLSVYPVYTILKKWGGEDLTIFYIFNPFLLWSVHTGLVEPLYLMCMFSSILFYLEARFALSTIFLILSVLATPVGVFLILYYFVYSRELRVSSVFAFFVLVVNVARVQISTPWGPPLQFATSPYNFGVPVFNQLVWVMRGNPVDASLLVFLYTLVIGAFLLSMKNKIAMANLYLLLPSLSHGLNLYIDAARTASTNLGIYLPFKNRKLKKAKYFYCILSLIWLVKTMNIYGL